MNTINLRNDQNISALTPSTNDNARVCCGKGLINRFILVSWTQSIH